MAIPTLRVAFIVESGTDVRLVDGLASRCRLTVVARRIEGGRAISQPTEARFDLVAGPAGFGSFAAFALRWLVRSRREIDVVILQGYGVVAAAGNAAARLIGTPAVMLVCSPAEAYYECRLVGRGRPYRRAEHAAIRVLARINALLGQRYVVLSPYLASVVRAHGTRRPVDQIPVYGVDTSLFGPTAEPQSEIRRRLGLPADARLVFFSSRIAPEKDPETLLAAVASLRAEGRDVRVLHLSGGYTEFLGRAAEHGLNAAVVARDAVPPFTRLVDWYHAADVCVQASREEGLGFSPLEALASGVPVIAAAVGGLRDTIRPGDTGWTYPAGDAAALAAAIGEVLDDPAEGRRRAARGRELVRTSYERERTFDRFVERLEALKGGRLLKGAAERAVAS